MDWLTTQAPKKPAGEYEIRGRDIYASTQTVSTIPRGEGLFEAHKKYIDIHYCLEGGEVIEWAPVDTLTPKTEFDTEKDYGLFESPAAAEKIVMKPGHFATFLPADAHMPKLSNGKNKTCKKVVVKINTALL